MRRRVLRRVERLRILLHAWRLVYLAARIYNRKGQEGEEKQRDNTGDSPAAHETEEDLYTASVCHVKRPHRSELQRKPPCYSMFTPVITAP